MAQIRVKLSDDTFERLFRVAAEQRRPIDLQAEWLLMQSLGLPFPREATAQLTNDSIPAGVAGG